MLIVTLVLLGISLLLLLLSFFLRDPIKDLREEIDQLSIQQVQELYKMKKKLKVLEEELMIGEEDFSFKSPSSVKEIKPIQNENTPSIHAIIKNQVWTLAASGVPIDQIANQSSLSISQVQHIINEREGQ
ncbi:hypothetical protein ACTQ5K_04235 [Niallia sp. Sow4_A1]|jgi:hypothetical protein|uniref:DUF2802 domain-containing protein n=1 Tax=Niallia hominis TaxID=3133173 RepID=A0ABV1EUX7_9BACI|nr:MULTISPECIES: hypothetical protein [Bacillaceae]MCF2646916.1 hypothetical protein [Niallia circulans]MCM3360884.1 hypothetical protein [Niallia sp. MER TA 168]CAI9388684.1 hypothetical protein BACSP_00315 [Bacillus sp. T2.9-1]